MKKKKSLDQISLFDIELPPYNEADKAIPESDLPEYKPVNMAVVPDEEYQYTTPKDNIPTVTEILKMLEKGLYKVNAHEFLSDVFECGAIAISNRFDFTQYQEREERYMRIIKKYDSEMQRLITEIFAKIFLLLTQQINPAVGFNDYLGELYMRSETSNSKAGQFFTPYCVSKACAEISVNEALIKDAIEKDRILTLSEPACGAGGMVIAAADVLYYKYHFNYSRNLVVECSDIDSRCVHMTYLQLGLAGIPAVIFRRNTITLETWERWETPAYIMQYTRFKGFLQGTANDWKSNHPK
jgi:type I restriction-modification system DNA methylase subunit